MLENFGQYGYLGIFVAILASSVFPIPEELPVITAGILVGHQDTVLRWYVMLPVVMVAVVIGDGILYGIGRVWGRGLLNLGWVKRNVVTPEKREQIEKNFHDRGIMILLGARLLPGIRGPIFIMAGVLRVPLGRFLVADAIYAIPLVNVIFWLSYALTDQVMDLFNKLNEYKPLVVSHLLAAVAGALVYKFLVGRHVSTGDPPHVPQIISKPAEVIGHVIESAVEKVTGRHHHESEGQEAGAGSPEPGPTEAGAATGPTPDTRGPHHPADS